ncbi:hypothetical protein DICVIV_13474 [Dictyocaulus viviparus]|uniref:Uncharacterized protein n=1 Tax=Dictyocaulus viviparus TaxID=29172 RepID=A0A0D8X9X3_DICVI|nr:hypothetical protein DICVIV_13474 [Dictyocaulus viviparus]
MLNDRHFRKTSSGMVEPLRDIDRNDPVSNELLTLKYVLEFLNRIIEKYESDMLLIEAKNESSCEAILNVFLVMSNVNESKLNIFLGKDISYFKMNRKMSKR